MDQSVSSSPSNRRSRLVWLWLGVGVLLGIVIGLVLVPISVAAGVRTAFGALHWSRVTRLDTTAPSVVEKIRQLSRLETVEYSVDKIVEGNRQTPGIPDFLAGDRLLLIAHGEVIAGIDFGGMKNSDLRVDGDSVDVRLPPAQILVTRIDNGRTRVYERTTGLLVPTDPNLESRVRQAAEQQITQAALDDKILETARANAKDTITGLLYALGFRKVNVR